MSTLSTSVRFLRKAAALLLLPWLAWSCQVVADGDYEDEIEIGATPNYINITISVSANNNPVTRANPTGGEYGDGWEKGKDRENLVNNITLIFYQDGTGINTDEEATVACVKRYAVTPMANTGTHNHKETEPEPETETETGYYDEEVLYTTGNQKLDETQLVIGQSYKVLVVANAYVNAKAGDKIEDIRDQVINKVYDGTGVGIKASNFVMTSETDATVTLTNPTDETSNGKNKKIYYFDCIHIERLAARIDFNPVGSNYSADYNGYKYDNSDGNSFFVVTRITPFNLYNENEFYFKRIRNNWSDATPTISYLVDESKENYVVDPNTENKVTTSFSYLNPLTSLTDELTGVYTQVMSTVQATDQINNGNVIIGYAKENTLRPTSPLKNYATGIAFEVKYYANSTATPVTTVYYHYLRHQGENVEGESYQAKKLADISSDSQICGDTKAMNFGIVRNNIYRVSI
jgi:hypothetical protein